MDNKYRYMLLGSFITCFVFILFVLVVPFIKINDKMYVKDVDKFSVTVNDFNERIEKLKVEDGCKSSLVSMLDRIKNTHFKSGEIKIKDYYEAYYKDDKTFLDYYSDVDDSCKINNNKIYIKAMTAFNYPSTVKNRYYFKHEFVFKDVFNRNEYDKTYDELGTYTTKYMELFVLDELLEVLK